MNIFVTSPCPKISARNLDDVRRNKMFLETCQLLSSAVNLCGGTAPYKTSHSNHPVSIWARTSKSNYRWLIEHAKELSRLYTAKTNKIHSCSKVLDVLIPLISYIPEGDLTPFVNCARNKDKGVDYSKESNVYTAYKLYLSDRWNMDKKEPTWTNL